MEATAPSQRLEQRTGRSGSVSSSVSLTANSQKMSSNQSLADENNNNNDQPRKVRMEEPRQERESPTESLPSAAPYQDHERYIPQPERVTMATNTETIERPQPKRRTSVEAKKTEETQTSDNDSEVESNTRIVNQMVQPQNPYGTIKSKRTDSESSNCSAYRKSVSFDLDQDNKRQNNYYSGGSDAENDVFRPSGQRKGILRSPSPFKDPKPVPMFVDPVESEIERENPFRKEFLEQQQQDQQRTNKPRPTSVYEPESPNWTFEQIKQKMENISRSNAELRQEPDPNEFRRQIEGAKSMVHINRGPKPPRPPKPVLIKKANLVYNEGIEDINRKMFQGDFVEFEHDVRTNTIKEVQRPFSPEIQRITSPTPSSTSSMDSLRTNRQRSIDRPKDRPPPPPVAPSPPTKRMHSQEYEVAAVHFESLPLPQTPQWRSENCKVNMVVTQDEHRRIMLQENELRNSLQSDLNLVGLPPSGSGLMSPPPFVHDSDTESYLSSIAPEFSPVSTLQRPASPMKLFPNLEKVPVHLGNLPSPQHVLRPGSRLVEEPPKTVAGWKNQDTVSAEDSESEEASEDDSDDGIDIDKYLPSEKGDANDYYATATFSTFSGKETQV